MTAPVTFFDKKKADDAFEIHRALILLEQAHPTLLNNPQWEILRRDAFERFNEAFGVRGAR